MNHIRPTAQGVVIHGGKILGVHGSDTQKGEVFIRSLGGGIEKGEKSIEALRREFLEEIGCSTKNEELAEWFDVDGVKSGKIKIYPKEVLDYL